MGGSLSCTACAHLDNPDDVYLTARPAALPSPSRPSNIPPLVIGKPPARGAPAAPQQPKPLNASPPTNAAAPPANTSEAQPAVTALQSPLPSSTSQALSDASAGQQQPQPQAGPVKASKSVVSAVSLEVLAAAPSGAPGITDVAGLDHLDSPTATFVLPEDGGAIPNPMETLRPYQAEALRYQVVTLDMDRRQIEGAVAFVDISGFSALAHALGQSAKGAMILSQCINDYLALLIAAVKEHGGDIITFAGDAFFAVWQHIGGEGSSPAVPLLRATQCSLLLQHKYNAHHVPGTSVVLRVHIGIAYGFFFGLTMRAQGRGLFLLCGRPMTTVGDAVEASIAGQVCLTPVAYDLVKDQVVASKLEGGCFLVESASTSAPVDYKQPVCTVRYTPHNLKLLEEFLPGVLLEHLRRTTDGSARIASVGQTLALQRFVSVLFLGQPDLPYSDIDSVQAFATAALSIVAHNEGEVLQAIQDDKGLHLVAVFGLHPMDTPAKPAVQSALDMLTSVQVNGNKRCRIGVATGKVFCGIVGSPQRRAFDILGDPVNLACRLMQLCSEVSSASFLCDDATQANCAGKFLFRVLPQRYKMKGQSEKMAVYGVEESPEYENLGLDMLRRRLQVHSTAVCGRHQERALLDSAIQGLFKLAKTRQSSTTDDICSVGDAEDEEDEDGLQARGPTHLTVSSTGATVDALSKRPLFRVFAHVCRGEDGAGSPAGADKG
eukprot:RCo015795